MNATDPISLLLQTISLTDSFTEGSKKIASFIRKTEERFEAPQFVRALANGCADVKQQEYILFCLLDISRADFDMLERAVQLRQVRHLIAKAVFHPDALCENERAITGRLREELGLSTIDLTVRAARKAATWVRLLSDGAVIDDSERNALALLLTLEAAALKERCEWLSEHIDAYDMKAIARLLPLFTVCDEQASTLREIGDRIGGNGNLGRAVLTFEYAMRTDSFEKWMKKAGQQPSSNAFLELLRQQRARLIPSRSLVTVATLSRCLHAPDAPPLTWIRHALECCTPDGFCMDAGTEIDKIKPLLDQCGIVPSGSIVTGNFTAGPFIALIGTDMLTRKKEDETIEPSPRELVLRCMSNDALLLRLLENPRIFGTPGIIAQIACTSRSPAVLQKIANTRELYTGHANGGVPLALLKNPTHIPLNQIRQFINIQYISLLDMKDILHNPYGIRQEIYSEIKTFVAQRYR